MKINVICTKCMSGDLKFNERTFMAKCKCGHIMNLNTLVCGYNIEKTEGEKFAESMEEILSNMKSNRGLYLGKYNYHIVDFTHNSEMEIELKLKFEGETDENN